MLQRFIPWNYNHTHKKSKYHHKRCCPKSFLCFTADVAWNEQNGLFVLKHNFISKKRNRNAAGTFRKIKDALFFSSRSGYFPFLRSYFTSSSTKVTLTTYNTGIDTPTQSFHVPSYSKLLHWLSSWRTVCSQRFGQFYDSDHVVIQCSLQRKCRGKQFFCHLHGILSSKILLRFCTKPEPLSFAHSLMQSLSGAQVSGAWLNGSSFCFIILFFVMSCHH